MDFSFFGFLFFLHFGKGEEKKKEKEGRNNIFNFQEIAKTLRKYKGEKKVIVAVNKVDNVHRVALAEVLSFLSFSFFLALNFFSLSDHVLIFQNRKRSLKDWGGTRFNKSLPFIEMVFLICWILLS